MSQVEYDAVVDTMRLPEQQLWPMPIVMDTNDATVKAGDKVRGEEALNGCAFC